MKSLKCIAKISLLEVKKKINAKYFQDLIGQTKTYSFIVSLFQLEYKLHSHCPIVDVPVRSP